MKKLSRPIKKQSLTDTVAVEIRDYIIQNGYKKGRRLPTIVVMAQYFNVGQPTIREAIKKLETIGSVVVKHGSGMYVGKYIGTLFLPNPLAIAEPLSKKKLLELVDTRLAMEGRIVSLAINNLTEKQLKKMSKLLKSANKHLENFEKCGLDFLEFHHELQKATNNTILFEIVRVITNLYTKKQLHLINEHMSCKDDFVMHCELYEALKNKDGKKAVSLMESRLRGIRKIIDKYYPNNSE